uniref:Uncharacterized protein n=1 Tax=Myotis myotis TaxID=51298 RepID=A0A7J7VZ54_MYOMY|nr:hypothetical protein mMyoMyo1_012389 [Myotis myotis]
MGRDRSRDYVSPGHVLTSPFPPKQAPVHKTPPRTLWPPDAHLGRTAPRGTMSGREGQRKREKRKHLPCSQWEAPRDTVLDSWTFLTAQRVCGGLLGPGPAGGGAPGLPDPHGAHTAPLAPSGQSGCQSPAPDRLLKTKGKLLGHRPP